MRLIFLSLLCFGMMTYVKSAVLEIHKSTKGFDDGSGFETRVILGPNNYSLNKLESIYGSLDGSTIVGTGLLLSDVGGLFIGIMSTADADVISLDTKAITPPSHIGKRGHFTCSLKRKANGLWLASNYVFFMTNFSPHEGNCHWL